MTFFLSSLLVGRSPCQGSELKQRDSKLSTIQFSMNFTESFLHAEGTELICKGVKILKEKKRKNLSRFVAIRVPISISSPQALFISLCQYTVKAALAFQDQKIKLPKLDQNETRNRASNKGLSCAYFVSKMHKLFLHNRASGANV